LQLQNVTFFSIFIDLLRLCFVQNSFIIIEVKTKQERRRRQPNIASHEHRPVNLFLQFI